MSLITFLSIICYVGTFLYFFGNLLGSLIFKTLPNKSYSSQFHYYYWNFWKYSSFVGIIIAAGAYISIMDMKQQADKSKAMEAKQFQEVIAVKEFDVKHKIYAENAWWLKLTPEELQVECQAIAGQTGYDWRALTVLLNPKNTTLTFTPAGIVMLPPGLTP